MNPNLTKSKKSINLLLVLVILHFGCQNNPTNKRKNLHDQTNPDSKELTFRESAGIQLIIPQIKPTLDIGEIVKEMQYIKLETNPESLMGNIDKIIFQDEAIYISDNRFSKAIHIFDMQGKHLSSIKKQGRGPSEYIALRDFCIINDSLLVYDDLGNKMLVFDKHGEYKSSFKLSFVFREFRPFNKNQFLFLTRSAENSHDKNIENYSILIGNKDSIIYKGFPNSQFLKEFDRTEQYTPIEFNNKYSYSPLLSNTIFEIDTNGIYSEKYRLNFPKSLPESLTSEIFNGHFDQFTKKGGYYYFMGNFHETSNHLYFRYYPPGDLYAYTIYDKINDKLITFDSFRQSQRFLGFSYPITVHNNYFVGAIDPASLLQNGDANLIRKTVGDIDVGENPILILYKFNSLLL